MSRRNSLIELHVAVVLFGLAGLFGKWLTLSPFIIVLGRVFFASLVLGLILAAKKQSFKITPRKSYGVFLSLGVLLAVHWVCFFQSIQVSTVAVGLLSYSSFPLFTAFIEPLAFKERIIPRNVLFALLCVLGVFLIVPRFDLDNSIFIGVLWGLGAGFTFSILTTINRKLSRKYSYLHIAFYQDLMATLCLLPFVLILTPQINSRDLLLLVLLGVFCTALSHSLFIKGMKLVKAQTAAILSALEPVYGILLAAFLLREIPSLRTFAGGAVILGTALIVTLRKRPISS